MLGWRPTLTRLSKEPTVKMFFPKRVILTLDDGKRLDYAAGIQEVPQSIVDSDHWWFEVNDVCRYEEAAAVEIAAALTTARAVRECRDWLAGLMNASPNGDPERRSKPTFKELALEKFKPR